MRVPIRWPCRLSARRRVRPQAGHGYPAEEAGALRRAGRNPGCPRRTPRLAAVVLAGLAGWTCMALGGSASAQAPGPATSAEPAQPVDVVGATEIRYDAATEQYTFRGPHVVVTQGLRRLVAPLVLYTGTARRAEMPEGGTITSPTEELSADDLVAELNARHLVADGHAQGRFLDEGEWTQLSADRIEMRDDPDHHDVTATGHVVGARADQELGGDHVVYDRATQRAAIDGHASLARGGDRLQADAVAANLATHDAEATGHVILDRAAEQLHAVADRATYAGGTDTAVLSGHARLTRDRDVVTADTITMDLARNQAHADGSVTIVAYPGAEGQPSPP